MQLEQVTVVHVFTSGPGFTTGRDRETAVRVIGIIDRGDADDPRVHLLAPFADQVSDARLQKRVSVASEAHIRDLAASIAAR